MIEDKKEWLERIKKIEPTFLPGSAVSKLILELETAWRVIENLRTAVRPITLPKSGVK